jgi:hypothetical protein
VCMFNNSATLKGNRGGEVLMCGGSQGNWSCILVRLPCRYLHAHAPDRVPDSRRERERERERESERESVMLIPVHMCVLLLYPSRHLHAHAPDHHKELNQKSQ